MRWLPIFWCSNLDIMKINIFCLLPFFVSHLEMQKNKPAEIISAAITISYPGGNLEKNFRRAEINIFRWGSFFWIHPFYRNFIFNGCKPKLPQRKWSSPVYFVAFKDKIQCSIKNKKMFIFLKNNLTKPISGRKLGFTFPPAEISFRFRRAYIRFDISTGVN